MHTHTTHTHTHTPTHPRTPTHPHTQVEKAGLTLVAVIIAVGFLHFTVDFVCQRVKGRCRPRSSSTSVLYVNRGRGNRENEEACALLPETEQESVIFLDDGLIRSNENCNNNGTSSTSVTTQTVIPLVDLIDEPHAVIPLID